MNEPSRSSAPSTQPVTVIGVGANGLFGDFAVVQKLGEGGMGAVYLAEDTKLGRRVAIKTMKPEVAAQPAAVERFLREARAAAAVESDYIVPILHVGAALDGTPFIVMPFLKGEPLDVRLTRERVASLDLVLKVAREVAEGLAAAHAQNLIHRDVKPGNIWLEGDPASDDPAQRVRRCKILDFGLARTVDTGDAQLTASGVILGTPAYMAPEQARGERVDPRADLFSLGATLYRMATGKMPFDGPTPMAVLIALATETPRPVRELAPHVPAELADLIDHLMSKDREGRPRTAAEVAAAVRGLAEKPKGTERAVSTVAVVPAPDPISTSRPQLLAEERPVAPAKRSRLWVLAACSLALVPLGLWLAGAFNEKKPAGDGAKNDSPPNPERADPPTKTGVPPKDERPKVDPDRAAAEYVLSLGGCVCINDDPKQIGDAKDLPPEPFRLFAVALTEKEVTDAGLEVFAGCRHLNSLGLNGTRTGAAGLAHLKGCRRLQYLYLKGTDVSAAGLAHLKDCTELLELDLSYTKVDDTGLPHLRPLTKLANLFLEHTRVSEAGVKDLARALSGCEIGWTGGVIWPSAADRKAAEWVLRNGGSVQVNGDGNEIKDAKALPKEPFKLTDVYLTEPVKDAELAVVAGCKNLTLAYLVGTGITNDGLAHLKDCGNLKTLNLSGTKVDNKSAAVIKGFTKLKDLSVGLTDIDNQGVWGVANALPACRIQWDHGTVEPASNADRKAAEWVLSVGGRVSTSFAERKIELVEDAKDLPKAAFRLTLVYLHIKTLTDADLANFKDCQNLVVLLIDGTPVTDTGLAHLKGCKNLVALGLNSTSVTDKGVADLAKSLTKCKITWNGGTIEPKK